MRKHLTYIALLLLVALSGCGNNKNEEERRKWTVTLDHTDKRPYGSFLAYASLKYFFPGADVNSLSSGFKYTSIDSRMTYNAKGGRSLLVLNGFSFRLTELEWNELEAFVNAGNEVVIFCSTLDERIEKKLGLEKRYGGEESYVFYSFENDHNNKHILHMADTPARKYGYRGHSIKGRFSFPPRDTSANTNTSDSYTESDSATVVDNNNYTEDTTGTDTTSSYATSTDTTNDQTATTDEYEGDNNTYDGYAWSAPDTLGYVYDSFANVVRYTTGQGHITFHAAPLVMSNYFLLQDGNIQYLSALWHTLPNDINRIYWSDYYMRNTESSSTEILWRHVATKLAVLLGMLILLIYILFEGKRKQRIIPIIEPLKNDSVSFVETVGRLYYNKGNHTNLAEKMSQQFLEWVRTNYFLNTNQLNDHFIQQLTIKSGQPEATAQGIVEMIHEIRLKSVVIDDPYLYQLYNTIQQFYKNRRI